VVSLIKKRKRNKPTFCEDLEVFNGRGACFLFIRDYRGEVLKRKDIQFD